MPDNSFEHKLSQQMEDFSYPASDAVWQKLEANLLKRKKRRWAIIWFFSGLVLVSAGIYFFARPEAPNMDSRVASNNLNADLSENLPISPGKSSADKGTESNNAEPYAQIKPANIAPGEIPAAVETGRSKSEKRKLSISSVGGYQNGKRDTHNVSSIKNAQDREKVNGTSTENSKETEKENFSSGKKVSESNNNIETEGKIEEVTPVLKTGIVPENDIKKTKTENAVADSGSVNNVGNNLKLADSLAVGKNDQKAQSPKRHVLFGLRFEAGRSANSESSFTQNKSADMVSGPSAGGPIVYSYPYTQEPGFAFSIGAWLRKPINQRVNVQTGLTYHYYSTSTPVGATGQGALSINNGMNDMRFSPYYQQGDSANYQNKYHLLSVPIEMSFQINKGKKLPVSWLLGIEPGWMIGSNAVFKDTSGYLFSDNNKYNRFQLGIQTGISFRFFQKTQHALEIGPVFQYMLTPAFKSGSGYDGHLNFLGLRADWIFR